jgi:hypothetical protein
VKTAQIIKALCSPSPQASVAPMIDAEVGPLVERIVTAGRSIPLIRQHLFDFTHAIYVLAARTVSETRAISERAKLDAAHDRAEAVELYHALERAHRELDKIRFGEQPDAEVIALVGDELSRFDRPIRYAKDDE